MSKYQLILLADLLLACWFILSEYAPVSWTTAAIRIDCMFLRVCSQDFTSAVHAIQQFCG